MLKERIYPIAEGARGKYLVPTTQHPTWRVHGGVVYNHEAIRTGFLSQGKIPNLLQICVPDTYLATQHDRIANDLTLESVLVECLIDKQKYIGTIDIDVPFNKDKDLFEIKGTLKVPDGFTINFVGKDPNITGLILKELKLYISYSSQTHEFQFFNTQIGCITVVGVVLGMNIINETKDL